MTLAQPSLPVTFEAAGFNLAVAVAPETGPRRHSPGELLNLMLRLSWQA